MTERLTVANGLEKLARSEGRESITLFLHGSLQVELYKPDKVDRQKPHSRDEIYVIARGTGFFVKEGVRQPAEPGEVLFAPAGTPHRFEDFTPEFATWVFFYGPAGGEASAA